MLPLVDAGVNRYWADRIEAYVAELLPERYREKMLHHVPTQIKEYVTEQGCCMQDIVLRETRNGELMLSAVVDGVEKRALVTRKSADYLGILQKGGIHLSESELISYAIAYLL